MKRIKLYGAALLICAAAFTGYKVHTNNVLANQGSLLMANVEALAEFEKGTVMFYACDYLGCCGGEKKCFSGSISVGSISVEGTFFTP